ncbi:MAG: SDR family oxidoreductase [Bacteroidetes bacterium]|nr:SDR family oxidoreductase [Bacteroidota bacterium]
MTSQVTDHNRPVAVVTGGIRRLGLAITRHLLISGYRVVGTSHEKEPVLPFDLADHPCFHFFSLDYCNLKAEDYIATVGQMVTLSGGSPVVLINNAAVIRETRLGTVNDSDWEQLFAINLKGLFFLTQALIPHMKTGHIINIADTAGSLNWTRYLVYSLTKSGVIHLTRQLAIACAPSVQVNAIAPGTVIPFDAAGEEELAFAKSRSLLNRIGSPEEVIRLIDVILKSTFMTGSVLTVDGGRALL